MARCPSCGGILGRDCFNPVDCAMISERQAQEHDRDHYGEGYNQGLHEGYLQATPELEALKAEVERLRGLIEKSHNDGYSNAMWETISLGDSWNEFKRLNKL